MGWLLNTVTSIGKGIGNFFSGAGNAISGLGDIGNKDIKNITRNTTNLNEFLTSNKDLFTDTSITDESVYNYTSNLFSRIENINEFSTNVQNNIASIASSTNEIISNIQDVRITGNNNEINVAGQSAIQQNVNAQFNNFLKAINEAINESAHKTSGEAQSDTSKGGSSATGQSSSSDAQYQTGVQQKGEASSTDTFRIREAAGATHETNETVNTNNINRRSVENIKQTLIARQDYKTCVTTALTKVMETLNKTSNRIDNINNIKSSVSSTNKVYSNIQGLDITGDNNKVNVIQNLNVTQTALLTATMELFSSASTSGFVDAVAADMMGLTSKTDFDLNSTMQSVNNVVDGVEVNQTASATSFTMGIIVVVIVIVLALVVIKSLMSSRDGYFDQEGGFFNREKFYY